jgi:2,3-bisphosphoglycerate-dependent phosphoglycerate mutase/probable phosphoglycerate mutase
MRHGQTDWNLEWRMQGHTDIPLNAAGRSQAAAAAPSVAALKPEVIISSDLVRARDTAAHVADILRLPVAVDARLRETGLGDWEGLTRDEVVAGWADEWNQWRTTTPYSRPPNGETRWEVANRGAELVVELDGRDLQTALLVGHGGLIVGLTGFLLQLPGEVWSRLVGISNCHWVVLVRRHHGWTLSAYNAGLGGVVIPGRVEEVAGS